MEFNEKLQELRKQKGITQEELAKELFVSRTAISKWESGRGYPNIESLKLIAKFFSVTVDELLSSNEALTLAEESQKETEKRYHNLVFGLLDFSMILLLFLPFFASRTKETVGFFIPEISSAIASPASTSPPIVFSITKRPSTSRTKNLLHQSKNCYEK